MDRGGALLSLIVREMLQSELAIPVDYFHTSTHAYLQKLGVDPDKLLTRENWLGEYQAELAKPYTARKSILTLWLDGATPIGFSTCDTIDYGKSAKMHLHILAPENRQKGYGADCVRRSVQIYFEVLKLRKLYCEPNAYNTAPNRTLQKAGFKYLKTHDTTPGRLNHFQTTNLWVIERDQI